MYEYQTTEHTERTEKRSFLSRLYGNAWHSMIIAAHKAVATFCTVATLAL
jgi:hypothetical protein